jgi:hypothetical protein
MLSFTARYLIRFLLVTAGLFVYLCFASLADANTDPNRQKFDELFEQGSQATVNQNYDQALKSFFQALQLIEEVQHNAQTDQEKKYWGRKRITVWYVVGRTYQLSNQPLQAYKFYRQTLQAKPSKAIKQKVLRDLVVIRSLIQARIQIHSQPSGAAIQMIDEWGDKITGQTPFVRDIDPGVFTVTLSLPRHHPHKSILQIGSKSQTKQTYQLRSLVALPTSTPVAAPTSTPTSAPVSPLAARTPDNTLTRQLPPPPRTMPPTRIAAYSLLGVTAATIIVGSALMAVGQQKFAQNYGNPSIDSTLGTQEVRSAQTIQSTGVASLVVAGLSAGTAIVLFVLPSPSK